MFLIIPIAFIWFTVITYEDELEVPYLEDCPECYGEDDLAEQPEILKFNPVIQAGPAGPYGITNQ